MPRREDIGRILVIGSGPIVIGQACEFDYSGAQACKLLLEDGFEVVLVNSNPATIMTDPKMATRTYVEPITLDSLRRIIQRERPDALLPTLGGQTALNCAVELAHAGVLEQFGVEMIGCDLAAIERGEDRRLFAEAMAEIGLECARSGFAYSIADAERLATELGFPVVLRPSFTLGGAGGGIAYDLDGLREIVAQGLDLSPVNEVLVEESIIGWKEYEMEVMRDRKGNGIIVCSIENVDAMGVHTGDSITVAPAMTLTDIEYQRMRVASLAILEKIGVETGGSNVQFAVNPKDGRMIVIEMNPRVSRSSALASKATGFPIAKFAAKLAVGYTLDEMLNDITKATPACFEPAIDYVVVKAPRFAFEKFKGTDTTLTTRMKAVGEVMAIGRTFEEALNKAVRSLENGRCGLGADGKDDFDEQRFDELVGLPTEQRLFYIAEALRRGWSVEAVAAASRIDPWFIHRIAAIVVAQDELRGCGLEEIDAARMRRAKRIGLSDAQIAYLCSLPPCCPVAGTLAAATAASAAVGADAAGAETAADRTPSTYKDPADPPAPAAAHTATPAPSSAPISEQQVRQHRRRLGVLPTFKTVDTCAAEFASSTSYYYKTYEDADEVRPASRPRAMILGAGPNRIGQGIEFDYCCVHASYALAEMGFETVMVNCNPETVSTDYDTSDRLYFEPLTFEDVMDIVDVEQPQGVVVTLGGQTPLKLAWDLERSGVNIMGTKPEAIDLAEDRERFAQLLDGLGIDYPEAGTAESLDEALGVAKQLGFPLLVRPSYVLGGRGMVIAFSSQYLEQYMLEAARVTPDHPVYLDRFLEGAIEVDVDALCDGTEVYIGGLLEHIEEAGIHSGDSSCCIPPFTLSRQTIARLRDYTTRLAMAIGVRGLLNIQFAVKDTNVYVLEVNPRASRTVPFTSKAIGVPLAKCAARIMAGARIADLGLPPDDRELDHFSVKEAVMPFGRFPGADTILGPEMKSTGEVMGIGRNYPIAYAKAALSIDYSLPTSGTVFISVCDKDKRQVVSLASYLSHLGFELVSTIGTAKTLRAAGIPVRQVRKVQEGDAADPDMVLDGYDDGYDGDAGACIDGYVDGVRCAAGAGDVGAGAVAVGAGGGSAESAAAVDAGTAAGTAESAAADADVGPAAGAADGTDIPNIADAIANGQIDLMINTPMGQNTRSDGFYLRTAAVRYGICYATTLSGASAMARAIEVAQRDGRGSGELDPIALQDLEQWEV
jgi:carbamoyl-phosphate synthase large subunit